MKIKKAHEKNFVGTLILGILIFVGFFTVIQVDAVFSMWIYEFMGFFMGASLIERIASVFFIVWIAVLYVSPKYRQKGYLLPCTVTWWLSVSASVYATVGLGGGVIAHRLAYVAIHYVSVVGLIGITAILTLVPFRRKVFSVFKLLGNNVAYYVGCGFDMLESIKTVPSDVELDRYPQQHNPWLSSKKLSTFEALTKDKHFMSDSSLVPIGVSQKTGKHVFHSLVDDSPHILVAGKTNSGKTVFLQTLIASLAAKHSPDELQLVLIDGKRRGFKPIAGLMHNIYPDVLYQTDEVIDALGTIVDELNDRIKNDITSPRMLIAIDELDTFFIDPKAKKAITPLLQDLVKMGREFNINVVAGSQKPSGDLINRHILDQFTSICLKVEKPQFSKYLLGVEDGAKLKGKGDLLVYNDGQLTNCQGYYTSPEDMKNLVGDVVDHTPKTSYTQSYLSECLSTDSTGKVVNFERQTARTDSTDSIVDSRTDSPRMAYRQARTVTDTTDSTDTWAVSTDSFTDSQTDNIMELLDAGMSIRNISKELNVKKYIVEKVAKEWKAAQ